MMTALGNIASPVAASRPQTSLDGAAKESAIHKKLRQAAQEFEGMLITELMQNSNMGFSSLTGDAPTGGSDTLNSLAIQTLSSGLAAHGGMGIANMIVHQLEPSLNRIQQKTSPSVPR